MKIVILNGSGRANGNSRAFADSFKKGAESKGHAVETLNVGSMRINGCIGCEGCHKLGKGCVQKDDMEKVYSAIEDADMVVFTSAVHYWGLTGQLESAITRFYAMPGMKPKAMKYALILSSGSEGVYDGIVSQYKDMVGYFGAESLGIKTVAGEGDQKTEGNLRAMFEFGASV
ncbi:MAG TPA: FMN reductase [Spirochaetaceae bacterium]|nr:FMN reductase [Spirochaetaceae bacterium]